MSSPEVVPIPGDPTFETNHCGAQRTSQAWKKDTLKETGKPISLQAGNWVEKEGVFRWRQHREATLSTGHGPQEMGIRSKEKFAPESLQELLHVVDAS